MYCMNGNLLTKDNIKKFIYQLNIDIQYYESLLVPCITRSFDIDSVIREHKRAVYLLKSANEYLSLLQ